MMGAENMLYGRSDFHDSGECTIGPVRVYQHSRQSK